MPLINREINFILICYSALSNAPNQATFEITDTKVYVPIVTLSTQDNAKPLQQLKFKRTILIRININQK